MSREEYIGALIARTHRILRKRLTETLREFEITAQQFRLLRVLYENEGLPASELVVRLFSDSSTVMELIDRLEEKGLVERQTDPRDRRLNPLFLTDRARTILPKILHQVDRFEEAIHRRLTPAEIEVLKAGLNKLYELAASIGRTVPPGINALVGKGPEHGERGGDRGRNQ